MCKTPEQKEKYKEYNRNYNKEKWAKIMISIMLMLFA